MLFTRGKFKMFFFYFKFKLNRTYAIFSRNKFTITFHFSLFTVLPLIMTIIQFKNTNKVTMK